MDVDYNHFLKGPFRGKTVVSSSFWPRSQPLELGFKFKHTSIISYYSPSSMS